jgi:hypothetical protein
MITNKNTLSFRCQKWMPSWVDCISAVFPGGRSNFLRLLLLRTALEQDPPARGIGRLFNKQTTWELPVGDSYPFHVRVNDATLRLIRDAAGEHNQTVAEWSATATYLWRNRFKNYQENKELKEGVPQQDWLPEYSRLFIENANLAAGVYTQKRGHPPVLTDGDAINNRVSEK